MSEITQGSNPNHVHNAAHKSATGVDLAPINISPSKRLWQIECAVYGGILLAASIALLPFFLTAFYWPFLWLLFLSLVIFVLRKSWCIKNSSAVTLGIQNQLWRLKYSAGEFTVVPCADILLWSGVIVLPLRETVSGRKHTIVVLPDSVGAEDWRYLRVWLRTGLRNNR